MFDNFNIDSKNNKNDDDTYHWYIFYDFLL